MLIFIAIIAFGCFIYFPINISQVISYIIFISSIVASITIYATTLYLENDFKVQQKIKYDRVIEKTKEYFAGDIQVEASWQDDSNITQPLRRMIIHRSGKKYNVVANSNDPEKFFSVSELIQPN